MEREEVRTIILRHAPGNGTTYRIFLTPDPWGGFNWTWCPEGGVFIGGWAARHKGGEVRQTAGKRNKVDLDAITEIIDAAR